MKAILMLEMALCMHSTRRAVRRELKAVTYLVSRPWFAYSLHNFYGLQWWLRVVYCWAFPLLSIFFGQNFCTPVMVQICPRQHVDLRYFVSSPTNLIRTLSSYQCLTSWVLTALLIAEWWHILSEAWCKNTTNFCFIWRGTLRKSA